ncbi:glycosyltransferase [Cuneatibacter sp. NSJ-177]|uniref:glycosyltransferase family 2 protein n=1 Tax=Cuneatibacter sp. NSJ-177 TaxID=2931401 RepID=UPI001FD35E38|nr:glycosyltransferase family 2 protein [Cuneatibacter sp. NSJ-177]MCJ7836927.1 glycosyltransferase [Cuneatibacter sp. NSJ-177]
MEKYEAGMISIIVPVYNVENYLETCIHSIQRQSDVLWELILVDDGSTDQSGAICDLYAEQDNRIFVIHKRNGGSSSARNAGIKQARGEFLLFVDSDDFLIEGILVKLYRASRENNADVVCTGVILYYSEDFQTPVYLLESSIKMTGKDAFSRMLLREDLDSNSWGKLYKRSFFENIQFPENVIFEDILVTYRVLLQCDCVVHLGIPGYFYRIREDSITGSSFSSKYYANTEQAWQLYQIIRKDYPDLEVRGRLFYLDRIVYNLHKLAQSENLNDHRLYYDRLIAEWKKNWRLFFRSSFFTVSTKLWMLLIIFKLYKPMRKVKKIWGK